MSRARPSTNLTHLSPQAGTSSKPKPGESVGPYRIGAEIGAGGMGSVYEATSADGEKVALKLVKPELASDATFRRRFEREARFASLISHPNVVEVLDTGIDRRIPYIVQRFVVGRTLEQEVDDKGPLPVQRIVEICTQIAAGLEAIHAQQIVHRDLKPANVMLDDAGNVHITDFGLAKQTDASMLTMPGQALGSMDYMSPEQVRGQDVQPTSDIYALGCITYTCVAGRPPFADRRGMKVLWAHLRDEPPDPLAERDDVPAAFGEVLLSAMAKEQEQRPQSASAYARMLAQAAGSPG